MTMLFENLHNFFMSEILGERETGCMIVSFLSQGPSSGES